MRLEVLPPYGGGGGTHLCLEEVEEAGRGGREGRGRGRGMRGGLEKGETRSEERMVRRVVASVASVHT